MLLAAKRPLVGLSRRLNQRGGLADTACSDRPFVMDDLGDYVSFRLLESDRDAGPAQRESSVRSSHEDSLSGWVWIDRPGLRDPKRDAYESNGAKLPVPDELRAKMPLVPVVRDYRLADEELRDRFLTRVFTLHRWRQSCGHEPTLSNLQAFHAANKSLLTAHDESSTRALGRSIASCRASEAADLATEYITQVMRILNRPAGRGAHVNVLQHLLGHFRGAVEQPTRIGLHQLLREYAQGQVCLAAVRRVFHRHAQAVGSRWLQEQTYFAPYPLALCEEG